MFTETELGTVEIKKSNNQYIHEMNRELRKNLRIILARNNKTLKDVARYMDVGYSTINNYFAEGRNLIIPIGVVYAVCRITETNFFHAVPMLMKDLA